MIKYNILVHLFPSLIVLILGPEVCHAENLADKRLPDHCRFYNYLGKGHLCSIDSLGTDQGSTILCSSTAGINSLNNMNCHIRNQRYRDQKERVQTRSMHINDESREISRHLTMLQACDSVPKRIPSSQLLWKMRNNQATFTPQIGAEAFEKLMGIDCYQYPLDYMNAVLSLYEQIIKLSPYMNTQWATQALKKYGSDEETKEQWKAHFLYQGPAAMYQRILTDTEDYGNQTFHQERLPNYNVYSYQAPDKDSLIDLLPILRSILSHDNETVMPTISLCLNVNRDVDWDIETTCDQNGGLHEVNINRMSCAICRPEIIQRIESSTDEAYQKEQIKEICPDGYNAVEIQNSWGRGDDLYRHLQGWFPLDAVEDHLNAFPDRHLNYLITYPRPCGDKNLNKVDCKDYILPSDEGRPPIWSNLALIDGESHNIAAFLKDKQLLDQNEIILNQDDHDDLVRSIERSLVQKNFSKSFFKSKEKYIYLFSLLDFPIKDIIPTILGVIRDSGMSLSFEDMANSIFDITLDPKRTNYAAYLDFLYKINPDSFEAWFNSTISSHMMRRLTYGDKFQLILALKKYMKEPIKNYFKDHDQSDLEYPQFKEWAAAIFNSSHKDSTYYDSYFKLLKEMRPDFFNRWITENINYPFVKNLIKNENFNLVQAMISNVGPQAVNVHVFNDLINAVLDEPIKDSIDYDQYFDSFFNINQTFLYAWLITIPEAFITKLIDEGHHPLLLSIYKGIKKFNKKSNNPNRPHPMQVDEEDSLEDDESQRKSRLENFFRNFIQRRKPVSLLKTRRVNMT